MTKPPRVEFAKGCGIDAADERERITDALLNVARSSDPQESELQCRHKGVWPADLRTVTVIRRLAGGRSGSEVLEIKASRGDLGASLQVAKLMSVQEATAEWTAYERLKERVDSTLYVPIVAVSSGVLAGDDVEYPRSVVVYRHVAQWDHSGDGTLQSLEDIVNSSIRKKEQFDLGVSTLVTVMRTLSAHLYGTVRSRTEQQLEGTSLGFDLELTVDKIESNGNVPRLVDGNPGSDDKTRRVTSTEVLTTSASPPGEGRSITVDSKVRLTLKDAEVRGSQVIGTYNAARVLIHLTGTAKEGTQARKIRKNRSVEVLGRVTAVRSQCWSSLLRSQFAEVPELDALTESADALTCSQVDIDHPMAALSGILKAASDRSMSSVHGDLNPRNIILSGTTPYLIDFASFEEDDFLLSDVAWLEICILRDCVAQFLTWPQMVQLQRFLGLLTVLAPIRDAQEVTAAAASLAESCSQEDPRLGRCLSLLWQVRYGIWNRVPDANRADWPRHYFEHLTLAACRTLKWGAEGRPKRVVASAAAAGVASECLASPALFSRWPAEHTQMVLQPLLALDNTDLLTGDLLMAASLAADDHARGRTIARLWEGPLAETVQTLHRVHTKAEPHSEVQQDAFTYISLEGHPLIEGEPCIQQGSGALSLSTQDCLALLARQEAVVLLADAGSGKTTVAKELQIRSVAVRGRETSARSTLALPLCLPLTACAPKIRKYLQSGEEGGHAEFLRQLHPLPDVVTEKRMSSLLKLGAVHLTVDALHEVSSRDRRHIMEWLKWLRKKESGLRLLVCQRIGDYLPSVLRWPAVVLHKVRQGPARQYVADVLRKTSPDTWQERCLLLEEHLFHDAGASALRRDLASRPLFLRILVEHYDRTGEIPTSPGLLLRQYLNRSLQSSDPPVDPARLMILLNALAAALGDSGSLSRAEALEAIEECDNDRREHLLTALLSTEAIREDSDRIAFRDPLVQAYCAAMKLQECDDPREVNKRILQHGWRDAAVLLVADPETNPAMVSAVVRAGVTANPWYGALLLQAAPESCIGEIRVAFLQKQQEVLRSPDGSAPAWKRSAYALAKYGAQPAMDILSQAATAKQSAPEAAEAALDGLVMMHQWCVPHATERLRQVLCTLLDPLDEAGPESQVIVRGLRSVQAAGLRELAGYAWSRVDSLESWDVISQAWETLHELMIRPHRRLHRIYIQACTERLAEIDSELRSTADTSGALRLNEQRLSLLQRLASAGCVETLFAYRFRAGLAECHQWSDMIQEAIAVQRACAPQQAVTSSLLSSEMFRAVGLGTEQWRKILVMRDEGLAVVAAHYLLAEKQVVPVELLEEMVAVPTATRLSLVAAFVHCLPQSDHVLLERLLEPFLEDLAAEAMDAVASFVTAAETLHQDTGRRLALRVQRVLVERNLEREALHWPWCTAWRRVLPLRAETLLFLNEQDERHKALDEQGLDPTLLTLLGSADVLMDAPSVQPVPLPLDVRMQLLKLEPDSPDGMEAHQFVLLAASAGLHEALPFVRLVAESRYNVETVVKHSHGEHGVVEVSLAAHAVTAMGYLGRLAMLEDPALETADTEQTLQMMARETDDMHPSMERARLIGLGYWGQLSPLLGALSSGDQILFSAARNIVNHWLPGPRTPGGEDRYFTQMVESISRELKRNELPPETRAVLTELRISTEDRLGRYVG